MKCSMQYIWVGFLGMSGSSADKEGNEKDKGSNTNYLTLNLWTKNATCQCIRLAMEMDC